MNKQYYGIAAWTPAGWRVTHMATHLESLEREMRGFSDITQYGRNAQPRSHFRIVRATAPNADVASRLLQQSATA